MFFYLYDNFVLDKKYTGILDHMEARVIELGINGRVEKLLPLRNMKELIEHGIKQGAHTVVVVGNDHTFLRALQVVAQYDCSMGFLPFGETKLGAWFGVTDALDGCDTLSRRITKQLPLGKANQIYFLITATAILPINTQLMCNNKWTISTQTEAVACSITIFDQTHIKLFIKPIGQTGGLFRKAKTYHPTELVVERLALEHPGQSLPVTLDGVTVVKTPVIITAKPKAIKVIVGKHRQLT
ncbi:MAG: hypothetical protein WCV88_03630 [Patescibacteria group bacterium]|jgi:diacylglycerol kinase family enzyme